MDKFTLKVPASTSNLGSGFDTLSAALDLYLKLDVEPVAGNQVEWVGWDSSQENMADRALRCAFEILRVKVPGMRITMENPIPLGRGLGSSAAAIVSGIKIAERASGITLSRQACFDLALPLEGHPDNLAASFLGGWAISWVVDERMHAERLASMLECRFVVSVPEVTVSTQEARSILPEKYSRAEAVFNLQRCALLVHALTGGKKELLREATRDQMHQPFRARMVPGISELLERRGLPPDLEDALWAVFISGSGSAVIAMADASFQEIGSWMVNTFQKKRIESSFRILGLDLEGPRFVS
ncbi:MAG: homoserine kinase [Acidobacteria bacterium]|nr:homoserine kinase [Acidobacteriota bacterium]